MERGLQRASHATEGREGKKICSLSFSSLSKGRESNRAGMGEGRAVWVHVGHGKEFGFNFHQWALNQGNGAGGEGGAMLTSPLGGM